MRHLKHRHKLGVKTAHRGALLANLSASLILHKRIETTLAKAKALRPFVEQVITLAKKAHVVSEPERKLHYRRLAVSKVRDKEAVRLLFQERVEEFLNRSGGYTRIYKLVARKGDAAEVAIIELIDADDEGYSKPKKGSRRSRKGAAKPAATKSEEPVAEEKIVEEASAEESAEVEAEAESAENREEQSSPEESAEEKK